MAEVGQTPAPPLPEAAARQRIEDAVLRLFAEREFHRVKLVEVAQEARVSLQTIYKYYGDKETLFYACLDRWISVLTRRMIDHLQGIDTFKDRLRKVHWVVMDFFERHPDFAQMMLTSTYISTWKQRESFRQEKLMGLLLSMLREGRERGILRVDADETLMLDIIFGVIHRVVLMWIVRGRQQALARQSDVQFEMIWRAIAKPQQEQLS